MTFARINGAAIHYRHVPLPGRPTIVFVNSLGTDMRIWDDVEALLRGRFDLVFSDKRGHGLSERGDAPDTIETYAADLAGLLDRLALTRTIVCGLSIGGLIAQSLHTTRPDLVRRLILCDTGMKIGTPEMWNQRIAAALSDGIASIADGVMERWFTPAFHRTRADDLAGYRTMLVRQDPAGYAAACAAIRDADFTAAAAGITVPTLCIVGDQDASTPPPMVENLARSIAGARFEVIAGSGHIPCVEQPAQLARLIQGFVEERLPEGSA